MKQILYIILILSLCSCEDVVDISLNESEPKLVIDASLNWVKGTSGNHQEIYLSLTRPFFSDEPTPVNGATVQISNTSGTVFGFSQNETLGTYETDDFEPMLNETYLLQIVFENELYVAETQLIPVIPIDFVEQTDNGGINGEDFEIKPKLFSLLNCDTKASVNRKIEIILNCSPIIFNSNTLHTIIGIKRRKNPKISRGLFFKK